MLFDEFRIGRKNTGLHLRCKQQYGSLRINKTVNQGNYQCNNKKLLALSIRIITFVLLNKTLFVTADGRNGFRFLVPLVLERRISATDPSAEKPKKNCSFFGSFLWFSFSLFCFDSFDCKDQLPNEHQLHLKKP